MAAERTHFQTLDALRGVAAIAVVIYHVIDNGKFGYTHGYLAVDFFFLLSGFVIGLAYEPSLQGGLSVPAFLKRRALRLLPMVMVGSLLGLIAGLVGLNPHVTAGLWMIPSALLVPQVRGKALYPLNIVFWSILLELLVNYLHATSVRYATNRRLWAVVGIAGLAFLAVMAARPHVGTLWGPAPGISFLLGIVRTIYGYSLGLALSRLMASGRLPRLVMPWPLILVAVALILLMPGIVPSPWIDIVSIYCVFPAMIVAGIGTPPPPALARFARWLGGLSFPLYAIHIPVMYVGLRYFGYRNWEEWVLLVLVALVLATAADRWIDHPVRAYISRRKAA